MARRQIAAFDHIRTEGGILPPSLLQRIQALDAKLPGLSPAGFRMEGERLRSAAERAFSGLQGPWRSFSEAQHRLEPDNTGRDIAKRWVDQALRELGYGRIEPARASLSAGGREFPLSHLYRSSLRGHEVPIHLVGCRLDLDRRAAGVKGAATQAPHSLVQGYLNAAELSQWGFATNGKIWRVLRDTSSLSRQPMVEFDLDSIFAAERFDEFLLFWLVCHETSVFAEESKEPRLEAWHKEAGEQGRRALDRLRTGVERAIEALGQGFLKANPALAAKAASGELDRMDYFRQLLRMVYRLLILFVAEDRSVLLDPTGSDEAKQIYRSHYGTRRLRELAFRVRGDRRLDAFELLKVVLKGLETGEARLALPGLGGLLFSEEACQDLDSARLANEHLFAAVRSLAETVEDGRRTRVDFQNLGAEEIGSVYESLLELHPEFDSGGNAFHLRSAAGNERKTTGSYYTPDSLIQCLLDSALEPVVEEALKKAGREPKARENALLELAIIDPAVGSGHFLIAAARRLAAHLARIRSGDEEPSPDEVRRAMRDVVGRCLYGVDINPMAAELCKVSLWLESMQQGRPFSFLDHHIRVGNSLLGATADLIRMGIPDGAYKAIEGDSKEACKRLRAINKEERDGKGRRGKGAQDAALFAADAFLGSELVSIWNDLEGKGDDSLLDIKGKRSQFRLAEEAMEMRRLAADAWCAAFTFPKVDALGRENLSDRTPSITTGTLRRALRDELTADERALIQEQARQFRFFHPELAFPAVLEKGGFDIVIGNPPWERVKLQEKEFFALRAPEVAEARNAAQRKRMIEALKSTSVYEEFIAERTKAESRSQFLRLSGRFPLCGQGDVNTYTVFAELKRSLLSPTGRAGVIVPTGIATDDTTKDFFADLITHEALASLFDFENGKAGPRMRHFAGVHASYKFCLLTMSGTQSRVKEPPYAFFCGPTSDTKNPDKVFTLTQEDIQLLNPNTHTCPVFRTRRDAEITKGIYRRVPVLIKEGDPNGNPWGIKFSRMFDMSNDSHLFKTRDELEAMGFVLQGNIFVREDQ